MKLVVCGVSGAGKTTVGRLLASSLEVPFFDADDFHPPANVEKMRSGIPLTDADRSPWLGRLAELIAREPSLVLACSALKRRHREQLGIDHERVQTVFLEGSKSLIADRIASRRHDFMPGSLLDSQFDALEPPEGGIVVSIDQTPEAMCAEVLAQLPRGGRPAAS